MEGKEYFFASVCMDFECLLKEKEEDFANRRYYGVPLWNLCGCMILAPDTIFPLHVARDAVFYPLKLQSRFLKQCKGILK